MTRVTCLAVYLETSSFPFESPVKVKTPLREGSCKPEKQAVALFLEDRMGFEPMNTGFADQRVSHFAIGPSLRHLKTSTAES